MFCFLKWPMWIKKALVSIKLDLYLSFEGRTYKIDRLEMGNKKKKGIEVFQCFGLNNWKVEIVICRDGKACKRNAFEGIFKSSISNMLSLQELLLVGRPGKQFRVQDRGSSWTQKSKRYQFKDGVWSHQTWWDP